MQRSTVRRVIRLLVFALWLPLAILVVSAIRFGGLPLPVEEGEPLIVAAMVASMVLFTWLAALSLTLAVTRLHRRVRVLAYACGAVLAPLTIAAALIGGLFGPVGIVLYALVISLPAWIALGITALVQRNRTDMLPAESV